MTKTTLVIIGNGFDLHHGFNTNYADFGNFIKSRDCEFHEKLGAYFPTGALWNEFETGLAEIDPNEFGEDASVHFHSYASDDWSDSYHHIYQEAISEAVNDLTQTMNNHFSAWIFEKTKLITPAAFNAITKVKAISNSLSTVYLNFNYTKTLETGYGISSSRILYIHNVSENEKSDLILGHGRNVSEFDPEAGLSEEQLQEYHDRDSRIIQGEMEIKEYYKRTQKDTASIIEKHKLFWSELKDITNIYVLGHSLSAVDTPYFDRIWLEIHNKSKVHWHVSYYDPSTRYNMKTQLNQIGVPDSAIRFDMLSNF